MNKYIYSSLIYSDSKFIAGQDKACPLVSLCIMK